MKVRAKKIDQYNKRELKKIFDKMDVENKGKVSKNKLIHILNSDKSFQECYNLKPQNILRKVWSFPFKNQYVIDFDEFVGFLKASKENNIHCNSD